MDEKYIEMGEATQEAVTANALAVARKKALASTDLTPDQYKRPDCEVCEDDLPVFRMQKGLTVCTACQEQADRRKKLRAG